MSDEEDSSDEEGIEEDDDIEEGLVIENQYHYNMTCEAKSLSSRGTMSSTRDANSLSSRGTPAITSGDEVGREKNSTGFPSVTQQAALTTLQDYENGTIFAWLTGLRAFRPGGENWFQPGCLSAPQLEAISVLTDCTDSLISAWLVNIRCGSQYASYFSTSQSPNDMA